MHLDIEELVFLVIFLAFNVFMFSLVEGIFAKLFFVYWFVSILGCAVYILYMRDKSGEHTTKT